MKFRKRNLTKLLRQLILPSSIAFAFVFAPACFAMPELSERFYINDAANILSEETENYIFENSKNLDAATKAQIVVVTVPNLEGKDLESYATELFRKYEIGDKEKNSGLLLLLALEERKFRVEVGYGLEGALPDGKTGRMQDEYMIPYFRENKWDEGMTNGYKAFFNEVAKEYNYDGSLEPAVAVAEEEESAWPVILMAIFYIVVMIIISKLPGGGIVSGIGHGGFSGGRSSGKSSGGGFSGSGGSSGGGGSSRGF